MYHVPKKHGMPLIGLGTWKLRGDDCIRTIPLAYDMGYTHIDTADVYENHHDIAKAIRFLPREDLFITTKVAFTDLEPEKVRQAVPRYLKELHTDYIDLLLIHWPNPDVDMNTTLEAMMDFKDQGVVREIGVSNFMRSHLEKIRDFPIFTNQIEMHPYLQHKPLVAACQQRGIPITAYRPLAKGAFEQDPILKEIGKNHGKSASQVALRWLIQQDIVAIPKASNPLHLKANLEIFDFTLTEDEMKSLAKLDQNKRFCVPDNMPAIND